MLGLEVLCALQYALSTQRAALGCVPWAYFRFPLMTEKALKFEGVGTISDLGRSI